MSVDYSAMSLEEFVMRPEVVDFVTWYSVGLERHQQAIPHLKLGKVLFGLFAIWYTTKDQLNNVLADIGVSNASCYPRLMGQLSTLDLESSGIAAVQQQPFLNLTGRGVLVGIVDTGIDFTKESFIYEDGTTKIKSIWDQSLTGNIPEGFSFGAEFTETDINRALAGSEPRLEVPHRDNVGHGTFLASVMAGRQSGVHIGAAPDADLVVVKLKKAKEYYLDLYRIPKEEENVFESTDLMLGIEYILEMGQKLNMPVAICIAVGSNIGGHDGHSVLEQYLERASNRRGICIIAAAGDESHLGHHTMATIRATGAFEDVEVKVGENVAGIFLDIWNTAPDRMSVSVISPTGEVVGRIPARPGTVYETKLVLEKSVVEIRYFSPIEGLSSQETTITIKEPTPGIWIVRVHGDIILEGSFHIWLPMLCHESVAFMEPVPNYTVTVPATSHGVIACGAYNSKNKSLYAASSWGPTRIHNEILPDLVSPGVGVEGVYPTGDGKMNGTSVAAALTAGAAALMLEWGVVRQNEIAMNTYIIKAFLIRGCERDLGVVYPNNQWGYGRLNLMNSFTLLREE